MDFANTIITKIKDGHLPKQGEAWFNFCVGSVEPKRNRCCSAAFATAIGTYLGAAVLPNRRRRRVSPEGSNGTRSRESLRAHEAHVHFCTRCHRYRQGGPGAAAKSSVYPSLLGTYTLPRQHRGAACRTHKNPVACSPMCAHVVMMVCSSWLPR